MLRQIEVSQRLTAGEKVKVSIAAATLGAVALGTGAIGIHKATEKSPLDNTHREQVTMTYGGAADNETAMAHEIQKSTGSPDSTQELIDRLNAVDPGHDSAVGEGQTATIAVDVPNQHR